MAIPGMPSLPPLNLKTSSEAKGELNSGRKVFNFSPVSKPNHIKAAAIFGGFALLSIVVYKAVN